MSNHKYQSVCIVIPNVQVDQYIQKYSLDKFAFEVLEEVEIDKLKETEQQFIEALKPIYNSYDEKNI